MALAPTLQKHLDQNVTYEVITHDPTMSSTRTAQACHVSGDCLAKAIVLRRDGGYILASAWRTCGSKSERMSPWPTKRKSGGCSRTARSARFLPSANATTST